VSGRHPARILVVDDEPTIVEVVSQHLGSLGHQIVSVHTAEDAFDQLGRWRPDAVLTDLNLPGASGLEVVRAAKEKDAEVCVVVITGQATADTAIDALRHGAYDYVQKPFDLVDLERTLERGLEARWLAHTNRSLLEELKRHERELSRKVQLATWQMKTLFELSSRLSRDLNLDFRLQFVCEKSVELTAARSSVLFLRVEADEEEFAARASQGLQPLQWAPLRFQGSASLCGKAIAERVAIRRVGPGVTAAADGLDAAWTRLAAESILIVPLVTEQGVLGALVVLDKAGGFTQEDEDFLTLFAGSAAIALENAILYERTLELDRLKSEFVAVVSHEIRTPLTVIKGALEILGDDRLWTLDERQGRLLEGAQANCDRLLVLIRDILDFSKLDSNAMVMNFETASLSEVLRTAVGDLSPLLAQHDLELVQEIAADLPPVVLDEYRILQVVTNLVSNAIKFSTPGHRVHLRAETQDGSVVVHVRDEGEGIAPRDRKRLFKKFSQVDSSTTRKVGGTGLGLVICKAIVEAHGGAIWCESEIGSGSTFSFRLPVAGPGDAATGRKRQAVVRAV
jgi:signal transduction histidine kinase/ActR/RegA family two-component response regulator